MSIWRTCQCVDYRGNCVWRTCQCVDYRGNCVWRTCQYVDYRGNCLWCTCQCVDYRGNCLWCTCQYVDYRGMLCCHLFNIVYFVFCFYVVALCIKLNAHINICIVTKSCVEFFKFIILNSIHM